MKTVLINCSPKGNAQNCNTKIICEAFVRGMQSPCDILCIAGSDTHELVRMIEGYDAVIYVLPLYIHGMPGIMMELIQHLRPSMGDGKAMGFIIQAGFIETQQHKYIEPYFASLTRRLNYNYLGTVSKGEAAGIYMFPWLFKKVLRRFSRLGSRYEQLWCFDQTIISALEKPYELSRFKVGILQFLCESGLNDIGWHHELKKNNAYDKRLDRPFFF